jgi:hypothetical protein
VLIGGIIGVVVIVGVVASVIFRRRSHDDVHSVEGYHRQLHTLEEIRAHTPAAGQENDNGEAPFPASAFRVSGSSAVRLTEPGKAVVPPVPPPRVPNAAEPVTFDDTGSEATSASFMSGSEDRVLHSINHRPRRLGGPVAAIAAVTALIVVLVVTGIHSTSKTHHPKSSSTATTHPHHTSHPASTTTSTAPLTVSAPTASTAHAATYHVATASYSLSLAATNAECWVEATDTATGSVLFSGTLFSGQSRTVTATGPVTVIAGAPGEFSATVDGAAVTLPLGYQAPFTLSFATPQAA